MGALTEILTREKQRTTTEQQRTIYFVPADGLKQLLQSVCVHLWLSVSVILESCPC